MPPPPGRNIPTEVGTDLDFSQQVVRLITGKTKDSLERVDHIPMSTQLRRMPGGRPRLSLCTEKKRPSEPPLRGPQVIHRVIHRWICNQLNS